MTTAAFVTDIIKMFSLEHKVSAIATDSASLIPPAMAHVWVLSIRVEVMSMKSGTCRVPVISSTGQSKISGVFEPNI